MNTNKNITAFSAGTTNDHKPWITFNDVKLNYNEYLDIIGKLLCKMTQDLPELDFDQFTDDMIGSYSAELKEAAENTVYELHLENISNNKIETLKIQLKNVNKVFVNDTIYSIVTDNETIRIGVPDFGELAEEHLMKKEYQKLGAQYLVVDDQITFFSFSQIIDYAIEYGKIDDGHHKNNIIHLNDFKKD